MMLSYVLLPHFRDFFSAFVLATVDQNQKVDSSTVAPNSPAKRRRCKQLRLRNSSIGLFSFVLALAIVRIITSRAVQPFTGSGVPPGYGEYVRLGDVSQPMQDATVAMEDGHFYAHHGFDWAAIYNAFIVDIQQHRIVEGGSTITQQLAKNLFLTKDRTIWRKIQEVAFAVELEHDLSKQRILEIYVNTIDYGYGCHGITSAARYYFHETPEQLSLAQSAILVGIVPRPPKPDPKLQRLGRPQFEDLTNLEEGEQTALGRMVYFFPKRYSYPQIGAVEDIPLNTIVYPYKASRARNHRAG
jgi:membrane peptidoglycan carboxypeptidase